MFKYQMWECDVCGKTEQSDGFPPNWIEIQIRKGDYFHKEDFEEEVDKHCCSQPCANKVALDYYSAHRLEE